MDRRSRPRPLRPRHDLGLLRPRQRGWPGEQGEINGVGFSVMKTANKQVIADFKKTDAGKDVTFQESYGASGDQPRAVLSGLEADEVHLSL